MSAVPIARVVIRGMGALRGPGQVLAVIEDAQNIGASVFHNAPGEFHMTLPSDHPQAGVIEPWKTHYAVERWNGSVWIEHYFGIISDFDADESTVVFYGIDYMALLDRVIDTRYVTGAPETPPPSGSKYTDQFVSDIIADLLNVARAKTDSPVGFITMGSMAAFPEKVTIYTTFASIRTAVAGLIDSHRQGTGNRTQLSIVHSGGNYTFVMTDNPGVDRPELRMEYGGLVQSFQMVGFGDFATKAHGIGRTQIGYELFYRSAVAPGLDTAQWGSIEMVNAWEAVTDANDLERRVRQFSATASRVGKRAAIAIRVDALQPFDGFVLADSLPLKIQRGVVNTLNYGSGLWTIFGCEWRVFPDGHTETSLTLQPKEDASTPNPDLLVSSEVIPGGIILTPSTDDAIIVDEQHSGNGAKTVFDLDNEALPESAIAYVNGVRTSVTVGGPMNDQITFPSPPASGTDNISVDYTARAY